MEEEIYNVKQRLLMFLDRRGISKRSFYKAVGLSNGYLDKTKEISGDKLESVLKAYPELNIEWLITGEGNMVHNGKVSGQENGKVSPNVHPNLTIKSDKSKVGQVNTLGDNANMNNTFGKPYSVNENIEAYVSENQLLKEELNAKELEIIKLTAQIDLLKDLLNR